MAIDPRFEEWFAAIEAGDGTIPVPQSIADGEAWNEHIGRRQIALGAWEAAKRAAELDAHQQPADGGQRDGVTDPKERWFTCSNCRAMVSLPSDTPAPARCSCSPSSFSLLPARIPKGYELRRLAAWRVVVDEAMVERALEEWERLYGHQPDPVRMRAALTAALSGREATGG